MTEQTNPTGTQTEILIVEDSPVEAEMLRRILVRAGYRVPPIAKNGAEGLQALREHPCTLVMSDINMPVMDGYELCHAIKYDEKLWATPVILVTMLSEPKDIIKALDVGADGYITKPYVEDVLLGRIRSLLANPATRKLAEERRRILLEYGGEKHSVAVGSPQMANLMLSVYENSMILNQELMDIQNQLTVLNEGLDQKVRERTAALQESEAKFRAIFSNAKDGIVLTDAESGMVADCNPEFERQSGRPLAQLKTLHIWELRPPEQQQAARRKFEEVMETGRGSAELGFQRPDGTFMPAEVVVTRVCIGDHNYLISISRDITERMRMEKELKLHGEIERNMAEAVYLIRVSDGVIVHTNQFFERMFGYGPGELVGKHVSIVNAPGDQSAEATANEIISTLNQTGVWNGEVHNIRKDGSTFWCRANVFTFEHPQHGKVWLSMHQDITELKRAEAQIAEQLDELKRWYEAMQGRELRVIELKREVNELLGQTGQPPRYLSVVEQPDAEG